MAKNTATGIMALVNIWLRIILTDTKPKHYTPWALIQAIVASTEFRSK